MDDQGGVIEGRAAEGCPTDPRIGIAFGPVPSRRLGQSLGINNIPPKHCSYSCVYCQVGATRGRELERRKFFDPDEVAEAVSRKVDACREAGQRIDHLTFVPDGEPTLDLHLGDEIRALRPLGIPLAVISNGSLLSRREVRADLAAADRVSVKVDAVDEETWRRVNRPHPGLRLAEILRGLGELAANLPGELLTETMLVAGVNDSARSVERIAEVVAKLAPARAYLAVPTRPPTLPSVRPPEPDALVRAYEIFVQRISRVELLAAPEEGTFGSTGEPADDLLAILSVHPMPEAKARRYLADAGAGPGLFGDLVRSGQVHRVEYGGDVYLLRRLAATQGGVS